MKIILKIIKLNQIYYIIKIIKVNNLNYKGSKTIIKMI